MSLLDNIISNIPEVKGPTQKRLSFKEKAKWTLTILFIYFVLGNITLVGLDPNSQFQFEQIAVILGAVFGSIISLGIGPIVTASIVLQLLNGSGILHFDLTKPEGKKRFQGTQKLLAVFFVIFEAFVFVFFGGFRSASGTLGWEFLLVLQLFVGGMMVLYMDETVQKWGFGSGISLFIVAGVAQEIFVKAFSPFDAEGNFVFFLGGDYLQGVIGKLWYFIMFIADNDPVAWLALASIIATFLVFAVSVYTQAMKVEIPLSFGRIRGYGMRWPLKFMYTSNIPVILVASLLGTLTLLISFMNNWDINFLGTVDPSTGAGTSGFALFLTHSPIVDIIILQGFGGLTWLDLGRAIVYLLFMTGGAVLFSIFWVQSSNMDARSQANQIMASGLQIPGFRRDPRLLERILERYIGPLTVMGGITVGVLAALADLTGALSRGTGILLAVMIVYQLYEEIAKQHAMDMHPAMRKLMGG